MRRPLLWVLAVLLLLFSGYRALFQEKDNARYFIFQGIWEEETEARIQGQIDQLPNWASQQLGKEDTGKKTADTHRMAFLKNVTVTLQVKGREEEYSLIRLLAYLPVEEGHALKPGNQIQAEGTLMELEQPGNPGQFNQQDYYREKDIYYQFQGNEYRVTDSGEDRAASILYLLRDRMAAVYAAFLPEKEGGIVTAMILGDKSLLDMDVKTLYQENGIGHLLAISGLHITILSMGLFRLLRGAGVAEKPAVLLAATVLLAYGKMVDYGISTSRAVIMMVLYLLAIWVGRTYDMRSAIAASALLLLLQKPFALYSCSFLLSFGAMAGIAFVLPALEEIFYGDREERRRRKRYWQRWEKEKRADHWYGGILAAGRRGVKKTLSLLLVSISVQLTILPIILYFYYETPVYGVFLNLLLIPLASLLVVLSFLGGMVGICLPAAGCFLLGGACYLLRFYEWVCRLFAGLPHHLWLSGRPADEKLIFYYGVLACFLLAIHRRKKQWEKAALDNRGDGRRGKGCRYLSVLPLVVAVMLLLRPSVPPGFSATFLDVGQGDCIFLREGGMCCLVDGGSSSEGKVGRYRILPFLKYYGIGKLDCMIMTHSDEDHISGLRELLQETEKGRFRIGFLAMPDLASPDKAFLELEESARRAEVPVVRISKGGRIRSASGKLELLCLHPVKGTETGSANADSLVFSLSYPGVSMLLTGDLEGDGEEQVKKSISHSYMVLKVAHHGSRNSTGEQWAEQIHPRLAVISCGKHNRYGHPHKETLEILKRQGSRILTTPERGAITIDVKKGKAWVSCFKS